MYKREIYEILIFTLMLFLLCPDRYVAYGKNRSLKKGLATIKKEVKKTKERIKKQEEQEKSILALLNDLDRELDQKKQELIMYEAILARSSKEKEGIEGQIVNLEGEMERNRVLLMRRLRAMYKYSGIGLLKVVFSSQSLSELLQSITFMRYIARYDSNLLAGLKNGHRIMLSKKEELERYHNETIRDKQKVLDQKASLMEKLSERKCILNSVRKNKTQQLALLKDLEKRADELRKIMERSSWSGDTKNSDKFRGKLIWPVKGDVAIPFGFHYDSALDRRILNNGLRIKASFGTDIVSVASGKVIYAGWFSGYGKLVIIDHSSGFNSLYAHASEIFVKEGQVVDEGERIAASGDTDSFRGPELYFEIRLKSKPVDPLVWLQRKR